MTAKNQKTKISQRIYSHRFNSYSIQILLLSLLLLVPILMSYLVAFDLVSNFVLTVTKHAWQCGQENAKKYHRKFKKSLTAGTGLVRFSRALTVKFPIP